MPKKSNVTYHPFITSDHAPVSLDLQISPGPHYPTQLQLNTSLLSDDKFHKFIPDPTDNFLAFNDSNSEPISRALLWDSLRAYLRGQIISYSAHLRKLIMSNTQKLTSELELVEQQLAAAPSDSLSKRRLVLQTELDLITTNEAEHLLLFCHTRYYKFGDEPSRLLAHQLRHQAASRLIPLIKESLLCILFWMTFSLHH